MIKILAGYYFFVGLLIAKANHLFSPADPGEDNLYIYRLLCVLTSICLSAYFHTILSKKWKKALVLVFCAFNCVYYLFNNVIGDGHKVFDSMAYVLLSSTLVVLIFIFMHQLMTNVGEEPLSMNFDFWFSSSQLIYFLGSFLVFLTYGYLTKKAISSDGYRGYSQSLIWLWGVHNVLLFLSALLTVGSIAWMSFHKKSSSF